MKAITYIIREIIYDTGKQEITCMTNTEYAGFLRRKVKGSSNRAVAIKKTILSNKKLFSFSIQLKNHTKK